MRKTSCLLGVHDFKEGKKECQDCGLSKELFFKNNSRILLITLGGLWVFILIFTIGAWVFESAKLEPMHLQGKMSCNTGFVGLDLEAYNNIQTEPCFPDKNSTCFRTDMLMKHIKIKNIDGLNCNIEYSGELPRSAVEWIGEQ